MKYSSKRYGMLLGLLLILPLTLTACGGAQTNEAESLTPSITETETVQEEAAQSIEFPYEIEDGQFVVQSLFQSDIDNPDNGNEYGDGIASLEVTNQSGQYCEELSITVTMQDGEPVTFVAQDIPEGKTVWMFETSNKAIDIEEKCSDIQSQATFGQAQMMEDQISWSAEETTVTLQNTSSEDLADVVIGCHCLFDGESYFGGTTYQYEVGNIPAGESVQIDAIDCYLGSPEIVKIMFR